MNRNFDYKVRDLGLIAQGETDVWLAQLNMGAISKLVNALKDSRPLAGMRLAGSLNMTVHTSVFLDALVELGAELRWSSSNSLSTQDHAAAYSANKGIPVFAWKGQSIQEYTWCLEQTLFKENTFWPNMLLDDGGDLTEILHVRFPEHVSSVKGVSEETTSGIVKYRNMLQQELLRLPVMDVNGTITKSTFDNLYGCRESLIDGLKRSLNIMIAGKLVTVCGYGHVGEGCAKILRSYGAQVTVTEVDPIAALKAVMEGFKVSSLDNALDADIFVTATGNEAVINLQHILKMRNNAILCNMGHRDIEVNVPELSVFPSTTIKPQVQKFDLPNKHSVLLLASGKDVNLGCATGHSDFAMSVSLTNQIYSLIRLWQSPKLPNGIHSLPRSIDESVAILHLNELNVNIDKLTALQAQYIGRSFVTRPDLFSIEG